jgi:flagellar basal-body rod protein FlgF
MDRMVYVAMTGAKQLMQAQALVANNLANVSTKGFRADLARFDAQAIQGPGFPSRVNTVASGVGFDSTQGTIVQTGSVLDVAIDGSGWLAVQARDGSEAYTRGGSLKVSALGQLTTERGELVMGDNGPLAVPPYTQIAMASDGTISIVPQGQGSETLAQVGRLKLVNPKQDQLDKRPDGLVRLKAGGKAPADANVRVVSGAVETSNVNIAGALVDMIDYARQFDLAVRMMQTADTDATRAASLASLN